MNKQRLFGVFCACVFQFVFANISHAATIQYNYSGNAFSGAIAQCSTADCFSITATIEFSTVLVPNLSLTSVLPTPTAWSISDGVTTITDQTADFTLSTFELGTNISSNISQWNLIVAHTPSNYVLDELESIWTTFGAAIPVVDQTGYCTAGTSNACGFTSYVTLAGNPGTWTMTTVPLPTAAWLFGSGILAMIGIGRKWRQI